MLPNTSLKKILYVLLSFSLVAAACGSDPEPDATPTTEPDTSESSNEVASSVLSECPDTVTIVTDWFPEPEHHVLYQSYNGAGVVDAETGIVSGPFAVDPTKTLNIQVGGPLVGFQPTITLMATDPSVLLGFANTDEQIINYNEFPTTALMAPLEINPQIVMFSEENYPNVDGWVDVKETGAVISHFGGATYTEYLVDTGLVDASQLDGSYDGSPVRFIAEDGALMQQGFATQEPFSYENVFEEWGGRPIKSLLIHDSGYEIYQGQISILDSKLEENRGCLEQLVPVLQQNIVDFMENPDVTNEMILQIVEDLDSFWQLSPASVANTVEQMDALDIVSNGDNSTVGDFDLERVNEVIRLINTSVPSIEVPEGLLAEDLVTNEFIDTSIGR